MNVALLPLFVSLAAALPDESDPLRTTDVRPNIGLLLDASCSMAEDSIRTSCTWFAANYNGGSTRLNKNKMLRATLAGDLPQLERHYKLDFSGARGGWTLRLAPRDAQVKGYVETITLAGAEARLRRIEIVEASGDRSVMRILHDGK